METTFLSLPNEILTNFFENLSIKDRNSLATINNRLSEVEQKSGGRQFERIYFNNEKDYFIMTTFVDGRKTFARTDPLRNVEAFFNRASTRILVISGSMENDAYLKLIALSKTLTFKQLKLQIIDVRSCEIAHKLIQHRQSISNLVICLKEDLIDLECARDLLINLPPMKSFEISPAVFSLLHTQSIIDDDVLLHLIGACSKSLNLRYFPTSLTTAGIARAFEELCNNRPNLSVTMHIPMTEFDPFFRSLAVDPKFKANFGVAKHLDSGATLECDNQKIYYMREITMRGSEIPIR